MIISVTGKTGSGKTTASEMLSDALKKRKISVSILDADKIGKSLLENKKIMKEIIIAFGKEVAGNGKISRKKLAKAAFCNGNSLSKLNKIIHPRLTHLLRKKANLHRNSIIDAALFDELKLWRISSFTILVRTTESNAKNRINPDFFSRRKLQNETKHYDFLIRNNSTADELKSKIKSIASKITAQQHDAARHH